MPTSTIVLMVVDVLMFQQFLQFAVDLCPAEQKRCPTSRSERSPIVTVLLCNRQRVVLIADIQPQRSITANAIRLLHYVLFCLANQQCRVNVGDTFRLRVMCVLLKEVYFSNNQRERSNRCKSAVHNSSPSVQYR